MGEGNTEIQEIPLDSTEVMQDIAEEIKAELAEAEANEPAEIKAEPIKPKAKGRPKGSLNKGPPKPRAKRKTQIQEATVEEDPPAVYEPSSPKRNLKMPADPSSSDIAAAVETAPGPNVLQAGEEAKALPKLVSVNLRQ